MINSQATWFCSSRGVGTPAHLAVASRSGEPAGSLHEAVGVTPDIRSAGLPNQQSRCTGRVRRAYERGMATAEYAVGILAAVALALVLLRIITDNSFFSRLLRLVLDILQRVGAMIGS
ncbi:Protein of unknown function [Propionibacterium cyclohexanicum]|uniref:DUF4244 domain-containing protein n=2 Tax=Propionibacterium cyclohexanicum TaxID=64702 RepID=A0A1H9RWM1_9ACTN|nr:DUF4244 domain-containing protein [Propionibacterium cyclohexanicum]SER76825.1 Protein of unknown function [Propionibacterium cyclohexanicum]